jgi:hypothetical protein
MGGGAFGVECKKGIQRGEGMQSGGGRGHLQACWAALGLWGVEWNGRMRAWGRKGRGKARRAFRVG